MGTITDDDVPELSIGNATVTEGNSGSVNAVFTVSLSAASNQEATVDYATSDGTATVGSDYTSASGTLTFAPGATTKTITVTVAGDTSDEANETFTVSLSSPVNAAISATQGTGTGTITDDDGPTIAISDVTVTEGTGSAIDAVFTVSLSAGSPQQVTVQFATQADTATAVTDYTAIAGTLRSPRATPARR